MDCTQALEAISAALDGELSPAERASLSEHLLRCPDCRALAEDLGVLTAALDAADHTPPPDLARRVMDAVSKDAASPISVKKHRRFHWSYLRPVAAAAAVVLLVGGAGVYLFGQRSYDTAASNMTPSSAPSGDFSAANASAPAADAGGTSDGAVNGQGAPETLVDNAAPEAADCEPQDLPADPRSSAEEDELPVPSAAPQAPEPNPEPAAFSPSDETGSNSDTSADSGALEQPAPPAPFSQEEALELAMDYLHSSKNELDGDCTVVFDGLSSNERYYIFQVHAADGETVLTHIAVSLDGGEILDARLDDYENETEN